MVMITSQNRDVEAVISTDGAELLSVKRNSYEYMWQANAKYWSRTAPVLFPFVGRLKADKYQVNGKEFEMGQHGFARDMKFEITEQRENEVTLSLKSSEETKLKYPYDFTLVINYKLTENKLLVTYKVTNETNEVMYYSIGGHPAFNIEPGREYKVKMPESANMYELNGAHIKADLVDNKQTEFEVNPAIFSNDALIFKPENSKHKITILEDNQEYITMEYNDFKLMGVWAPKADVVPFICLEPWNGIADFDQKANNELKNKEYINELNAKATDVASYEITFN